MNIHSWTYCALVKLEGNEKTNVLATGEEGGRGHEMGEVTLHMIYVHIAQKSQRIL
jgi:hypothetical protein